MGKDLIKHVKELLIKFEEEGYTIEYEVYNLKERKRYLTKGWYKILFKDNIIFSTQTFDFAIDEIRNHRGKNK